MGARGCPFCGKTIPATVRECPFCHEYIPEVRVAADSPSHLGKSAVRRGLWYMLVLAAIYLVLSGQTPLKINVPYQDLFMADILPVLFFAALGFVVYGFYIRMK
ncbi:MAG TPA: hypothetical protein VJN21_15275 [Candidatus Acidoferrales bacterium]|nr:hypothetical protein [Candidatus Acidoferrales bacterium]